MTQATIQAAEQAIKTGERCRVLMDMILEQIGMTYENEPHDIWKKLVEVEGEHMNAVRTLAEVIRQKREGAKKQAEQKDTEWREEFKDMLKEEEEWGDDA